MKHQHLYFSYSHNMQNLVLQNSFASFAVKKKKKSIIPSQSSALGWKHKEAAWQGQNMDFWGDTIPQQVEEEVAVAEYQKWQAWLHLSRQKLCSSFPLVDFSPCLDCCSSQCLPGSNLLPGWDQRSLHHPESSALASLERCLVLPSLLS